MIVELRSVPGCPNLEATRSTLTACLAEAGVAAPIIERIGDYRSPSILINGSDVTGADPDSSPACVREGEVATTVFFEHVAIDPALINLKARHAIGAINDPNERISNSSAWTAVMSHDHRSTFRVRMRCSLLRPSGAISRDRSQIAVR